MAATLALMLAMSILLPSGAEMGSPNLVLLEWDKGNSDEHLSPTLQNRTNILEGLFVKEVGTSKFLAVLKEPSLARLKFRDVYEVTPVEDVIDAMKTFKMSVPPSEDISNTNLTLIKMTPSLKGQTLQQYETEFKLLGKCLNSALKKYPKRIYISKGSFPPKFYFFLNMPLVDIKYSFSVALDIFGGPGSTKNEISYVQILPLAP